MYTGFSQPSLQTAPSFCPSLPAQHTGLYIPPRLLPQCFCPHTFLSQECNTHMQVHMYGCTHVKIHTHTKTCMCVSTQIHMCMEDTRACTHIHRHVCASTQIHMCMEDMHAHMCVQKDTQNTPKDSYTYTYAHTCDRPSHGWLFLLF